MKQTAAKVGTVALVIDDEPQLRRLLRVTLEANGYHVFDAETGQEGMEQAAQRLPDLDGIKVLKRVREWSRAPVIILTVCDRESDKIAALDAGADDYVTKPYFPSFPSVRLNLQLCHGEKILAGEAGAGDVLLDNFGRRGKNGLDGCPQLSGAK